MTGARAGSARQDRAGAPGRPARSGAAPRVLRAVLVASALVAVAVFHIWSRTRVLATGYALGEQAKAHARLSSEHDRLRIEVETLRSPVKLEQYARTKLGMAPPAPGTVWVAGPRLASASAGRAGADGVGHRPAPAGPLHDGRAAGPSPAAGEPLALLGAGATAPPGGPE
jgi:cell division protein FtsL